MAISVLWEDDVWTGTRAVVEREVSIASSSVVQEYWIMSDTLSSQGCVVWWYVCC